MIYGLYNSAAGMMVNEYRQNVIANNLANADTTGFKQEVAVFAERQPESMRGLRDNPSAPDLSSLSGYLWLGETDTDFGQGNMIHTENETDVALDGPGFFVVDDNGEPRYTRDGRFVTDRDGFLRAAVDGAAVLSPGGAPIRVNPHGPDPTFDEHGRVLQSGIPVAQLAIVDFEDYRDLRKVGNSRFDAGEAQPIASPARVVNGFLESSGVEPVKELVKMIETTRAYEMNARMLTLQDQTVGRLIQTIAT